MRYPHRDIVADAEALASKLADDHHEDYPKALHHLWTVWRRLPDPYEQDVQREASAILLAWSTPEERATWLTWWRTRGAVHALAQSMAGHDIWKREREPRGDAQRAA